MAYIEVDVDLNDFDSEDLVEEVCKRLVVGASHRQEISLPLRKELIEYLGCARSDGTIWDRMVEDLLSELRVRITPMNVSEVESFIQKLK